MKRVQYDCFGGPQEMYFGEFDLPQVGSDEVRVSIKAAAVNPLDWKLRQGAMKFLIGRRFPKAMGTDFAGVVEAIGSKVTNLQRGDEVFGTMNMKDSGAFAEAAVVSAGNLVKKPRQISFSDAACLPVPAMTAWVAVIEKAQAGAGSRIFVNGCCGAVGAFAVQLAIAHGAHVSGSCGLASEDSARNAGVEPTFSYSDASAYARDGKFDTVFDTVGTLDVGDGLGMLKLNGTFVDINPSPGRMFRGMLSWRYKLAFANMGIGHLPAIARLAGDGTLRPTIGLEAPFSHALSVIAAAENGPRPAGRTVLVL